MFKQFIVFSYAPLTSGPALEITFCANRGDSMCLLLTHEVSAIREVGRVVAITVSVTALRISPREQMQRLDEADEAAVTDKASVRGDSLTSKLIKWLRYGGTATA